jgi:hypothetical protein
MITQSELEKAVALIKADQWDAAHEIAQVHFDSLANWLHAILHKIEGDIGNSHYWYARTKGIHYQDYPVLDDELTAIVNARK